MRRLDPAQDAAEASDQVKAAAPGKLTLGEYVEVVRQLGILSERTLGGYVYGCRWFAAALLASPQRDKSRFDGRTGGAKAWRAKLDGIALESFTANAVEGVMARFVAGAGKDPRARRKAAQSANSFARNARALFGRKILRKLTVPLPSPLPFAGLEFLESGPTRYVSTFHVAGAARGGTRGVARARP